VLGYVPVRGQPTGLDLTDKSRNRNAGKKFGWKYDQPGLGLCGSPVLAQGLGKKRAVT